MSYFLDIANVRPAVIQAGRTAAHIRKGKQNQHMLPSIYSKVLQSIQERVLHIKQFSTTAATSNLLTYVRFYFTNTTNSTQWLYNEITFWDLISKVKNSKKIRKCTKVFFTHLNIHTKASLQVSFSSTKKTWTSTMIRFV